MKLFLSLCEVVLLKFHFNINVNEKYLLVLWFIK